MALAPLATVTDLEGRLAGVVDIPLTGDALTRASNDLADASALVRSIASDVAGLRVTWLADDGTVTAPDEVVTIVVRAAKRSFLNPELLTSENVGGKYSYQRDQTQTSIALAADEVATIERAATALRPSGSKGFVGTIRTPSAYRSPAVADWREGWLPL